ncbi:kinase-like domain-containing protein [Rhizophagus clarus]|uniref:Kinase-like domain-containing protein n=1 Tax=Rhizophagus clarus TaxID=94130 RepID=A0A8H3LDW6_9GLOM|nr:kinase-like domain-containing protein [Rhizophagus clarus]
MQTINDLPDSDKNEIYGVLPFMAPELLRVKPYILASDIYSFSMIMLEVLNIDIKLRNDMLEFVKANDALVKEEANIISIIQPHLQAYYTSRKLTEIFYKEDSEYLEYMII